MRIGCSYGVLAGDLVVHIEEVAVPLLDHAPPEPLDRVREVEIDAAPAGADAAPLVADLLRVAGGDIARDEVAETRVLAFEEVIALAFGDLVRRPRIARLRPAPRRARRCASDSLISVSLD